MSDIKNINQQASDKEAFGFMFDLKFLSNHPHIKTMSIQYAIVGMMVGILIPLLLPYTLQELGGTKEDYGIVMLCFGLGGFLVV